MMRPHLTVRRKREIVQEDEPHNEALLGRIGFGYGWWNECKMPGSKCVVAHRCPHALCSSSLCSTALFKSSLLSSCEAKFAECLNWRERKLCTISNSNHFSTLSYASSTMNFDCSSWASRVVFRLCGQRRLSFLMMLPTAAGIFRHVFEMGGTWRLGRP